MVIALACRYLQLYLLIVINCMINLEEIDCKENWNGNVISDGNTDFRYGSCFPVIE